MPYPVYHYIYYYIFLHRTEKDKAPPSPHLTIHSDGLVRVQNDQVLVSTCRMHVYKFPFDIQSCNLSFKSVVHSGEFSFHHPQHPHNSTCRKPLAFLAAVEEIKLVHDQSSLDATGTVMRTQYEWLFVSMRVSNKTTSTFQQQQDVLIFTVSRQIYASTQSSCGTSLFFPKHLPPDHHEEAAATLHRQLPAARLLLPVSGFGLFPHL